MRVSTPRPLGTRTALRVTAASLLTLAEVACGTVQPTLRSLGPLRRPAAVSTTPVWNAQPLLLFENMSTESVTLYLAEFGGRRLIGHVQPGYQALLPLPITLADARTRQLTIVVVPLASSVSFGAASAIGRGPIESEPMLGDQVAAMRWRYVGRQLLGTPLPR